MVTANGRRSLLTVSDYGFGKRTDLEQYRSQSRGGKGIINMKITDKTGSVTGSMLVYNEDEIIILTSGNKMIRLGVNDISTFGRATQGVRLVKMDPDNKVVCFDRVIPESH